MTAGSAREQAEVTNFLLRVGDLLVALAWGWLAYAIYLAGHHQWTPFYSYAFMLIGLLVLVLFPHFALYQVERGGPFIEELRNLTSAWTLVFVAVAVLTLASRTGHEYSRVWGGLWYLGGWSTLVLFRAAVRVILKQLHRRGINLRHIVIAGSGGIGDAVVSAIAAKPACGLRVSGVFCEPGDATRLVTPVLGRLGDLRDYVDRHRVDQVWITLPFTAGDALQRLLDELRHSTVDIRYVPDVFGARLINRSVTEVAGMPVVNLSVSPMDGLNRWVKQVEDKLLALVIIVLASPLLLLIAALVRLSSPGPIIYRQERIGWNGERFTLLKFRTMPVESEQAGVEWGRAGDKRKTRIGAFLRRTSLDELPQFFNVLMGNMSVVGPRPERPQFVDEFKDSIPQYMKKHMVKAGITGWAQINGWRGDTDLAKRIEYDMFYIENWSLWFDLRIIYKTLYKGFHHPAAR